VPDQRAHGEADRGQSPAPRRDGRVPGDDEHREGGERRRDDRERPVGTPQAHRERDGRGREDARVHEERQQRGGHGGHDGEADEQLRQWAPEPRWWRERGPTTGDEPRQQDGRHDHEDPGALVELDLGRTHPHVGRRGEPRGGVDALEVGRGDRGEPAERAEHGRDRAPAQAGEPVPRPGARERQRRDEHRDRDHADRPVGVERPGPAGDGDAEDEHDEDGRRGRQPDTLRPHDPRRGQRGGGQHEGGQGLGEGHDEAVCAKAGDRQQERDDGQARDDHEARPQGPAHLRAVRDGGHGQRHQQGDQRRPEPQLLRIERVAEPEQDGRGADPGDQARGQLGHHEVALGDDAAPAHDGDGDGDHEGGPDQRDDPELVAAEAEQSLGDGRDHVDPDEGEEHGPQRLGRAGEALAGAPCGAGADGAGHDEQDQGAAEDAEAPPRDGGEDQRRDHEAQGAEAEQDRAGRPRRGGRDGRRRRGCVLRHRGCADGLRRLSLLAGASLRHEAVGLEEEAPEPVRLDRPEDEAAVRAGRLPVDRSAAGGTRVGVGILHGVTQPHRPDRRKHRRPPVRVGR